MDCKLSLEVEPLFCTIALYDIDKQAKISENFHFQLNTGLMTDHMVCILTCLVQLNTNFLTEIGFRNVLQAMRFSDSCSWEGKSSVLSEIYLIFFIVGLLHCSRVQFV